MQVSVWYERGQGRFGKREAVQGSRYDNIACLSGVERL
jgi:hypothetical protein